MRSQVDEESVLASLKAKIEAMRSREAQVSRMIATDEAGNERGADDR